MKHDIRLRHELADGGVLTIQRIRRRFVVYIVSTLLTEAPEYLADLPGVNLATARELAADVIRDDVCELR